LPREEGSQLLHAAEVLEDPIQHSVDEDPEREGDDREDDELAGAAARALLAGPLEHGAPLGLQHVPQRGLLHAPSTSTRARTAAPPASLRDSYAGVASEARG